MGKRWSKQKSGQQSGKRRKAKASGGGGGGGGAGGAGGTMSGFRGVMRKVAGTSSGKGKPKSGAAKLLDIALWIAVFGAVAYFFSTRCA